MKVKLICTECAHHFTMPGSFDWDEVKCPSCGFEGAVVGRKSGEEVTYFADEDETTTLPVVDEEKFNR